MSRTRLSTWLLFAVAIAAVLSHVCVLPHAHADEPVASAHEHDEPDAADDALHGASCEVLRASAPTRPVLDFAPAPVTPYLARASRIVARAPAIAARGPSPPLFLLYAALLI